MEEPDDVTLERDWPGTVERRESRSNAPTLEYVPKRMSGENGQRPVSMTYAEEKKFSSSGSMCSGMACGRFLYGVIIFLASISLVMTAIVHIFAWYEEDIEALDSLKPVKINWFRVPRELRWRRIECLMEVRWTFWMWIAVFFLQLIWIFYGMILTCRRTRDKTYLYESAATMPCTIYLVFLVGLGATALWNVFWGESGIMTPEYSRWGTIVIGAASFFFHLDLAIAVKAFITSISDLRRLKKTWDLTWNQLFTQNGLAAIACWEAVVTMYAISWVLKERGVLPDQRHFECAIGLSLIMFYMLVWFVFDLFFTKKALYYIFAPYLVVAVTFTSALVQNMDFSTWESLSLPLVLSGVFLSVTALFVVIKIITVCVRRRYTTDEKDDVRSLHDDNVYVMQ